jgi:hypothetical protein
MNTLIKQGDQKKYILMGFVILPAVECSLQAQLIFLP